MWILPPNYKPFFDFVLEKTGTDSSWKKNIHFGKLEWKKKALP